MAELKTKPTKQSVEKFLKSVEDEMKRKDCIAILDMMKKITKEKPVMWGNAIVGFGTYHYKSQRSSQEGDWFIIGFSPRKQNLTLYLMAGFKKYTELLKKLGKYKISGGSCLYIKKLSDVDTKVLKELLKNSFQYMKKITSNAF
jgi:23S rRNA A2030 N6-methylase RlmJ